MNPDTTPTPRTDACPHCGSYPIDPVRWECGALLHDLGYGEIVVGQSDRCKLTEKINEVARLREEANTWHQHYRDEASKAQKCKQAYIEQEKEVARLRELLNRAIEIAEDFQSNGHDTACYYEVNKYRCRCGFIDASDELDKIKAEARIAPAPEESMSEGTRIAAEARAACNNLTEAERENALEKANEVMGWRELGQDEVIKEGDEYYTGKWTKITGWIGYPASNFAKVRTRRPGNQETGGGDILKLHKPDK